MQMHRRYYFYHRKPLPPCLLASNAGSISIRTEGSDRSFRADGPGAQFDSTNLLNEFVTLPDSTNLLDSTTPISSKSRLTIRFCEIWSWIAIPVFLQSTYCVWAKSVSRVTSDGSLSTAVTADDTI